MGGIEAWNVVPSMKGIGYASVVICFFLNTYFTVILAWSVYYLVMSFWPGTYKIDGADNFVDLPYSTCGNEWNTECCTSLNTIKDWGRLSNVCQTIKFITFCPKFDAIPLS